MNKVLELYYERRINKLKEFYKELTDQEYNNMDVVKEFNEIETDYITKMRELQKKYNVDNNRVVSKNVYDEKMFMLDDEILGKIREKFSKELNIKIKELDDEQETINAVLSISDDKDYQIEVLKTYGILNKKGMMVEE